jgi:hypothetical protein
VTYFTTLISSNYRYSAEWYDGELSGKDREGRRRAVIYGTTYSGIRMSRVSSGSTVSDYGLDYRAIGVRSPAGAKDFSSILCVQTGSVAHPASCKWVPGVLSPGLKARPRRDADHSPRGREWVGAIPPLPPSASMACSGTVLPSGIRSTCRDWENQWKISDRISDLRDEMWIRNLLNTKQEC